MTTFFSHSPAETEALGETWASECARGWVIGLSGPLGAGKTQLVKGLARGLNTAVRVASPAYALVHEYPGGRLPLFHLDLYRLDTREQIIAAGLESYLVRPGGVTVVEWVERWLDATQTPGQHRAVFAACNSKPWVKPPVRLLMTILAIEFSSPQRSVALWDDAAPAGNPVRLGSALDPPPSPQLARLPNPKSKIQNPKFAAQRALGLIEQALAEAKCCREEIGALAVGLGPVPTMEYAARLPLRKDGNWAAGSACSGSAAWNAWPRRRKRRPCAARCI